MRVTLGTIRLKPQTDLRLAVRLQGGKASEAVRAGIIDDHEALRIGFAVSGTREPSRKTHQVLVIGQRTSADASHMVATARG